MTVRIMTGDCRAVLASLPSESVHCIVTSPPYFGLRDYGTAQWEGGEPDCDHSNARRNHNGEKQGTSAGTSRDSLAGATHCRRCGARRIDQQIGLEQTPDAYVAEMVAVFRECRRVLRVDGTLWLNLGDSYNSHDRGGYRDGEFLNAGGRQSDTSKGVRNRAGTHVVGLKPKDLLGIPWRVAFALQADGWYLRQDIIWAKPNPMPESVQDRCTKSHEYLFLLSKSAHYYYDAGAIAEPGVEPERRRCDRVGGATGHKVRHSPGGMMGASETRNRRSVWTIPTEPSGLPHFAMMPTALAELCIMAGCPKGGTVLDPFSGVGTTGLVADRLGRNAVLIELNPSNIAMSRQRIEGDAGMFASVFEPVE
jgi:DNA modification methylase